MLLRQTILYLPAQFVGPLAQFVSVILWTYFLSPEELGAFALITAAQELAYTAAVFWFTLYTVRYFDKTASAADKSKFLDTELGVLLGSCVVIAIGMMAMPLFARGIWSFNLACAAIAYSIVRSVATHLADRARTAADVLTYSIFQLLWPVAALGLGLLFAWAYEPTAAMVLWGYVAAQVAVFALAAMRLERGRTLRVSRQMLKSAARYAFPLIIGSVFVWFGNNGIRFVIEHGEGVAAVGLVTVGWGLGLRATTSAAMLVSAAAFPLAVAKTRQTGVKSGQQQLAENGILLLAALAPATAGLWAISKPLIGLIVAEPFRAMTIEVLPWAILAGAFRSLRVHFAQHVFLLHEETMVPLANDVVDGVATMIGGIVGLALGGIVGCVIGAAWGAGIGLIVALARGAFQYDFYFPLGDFLKISTAAAMMVLALQFLPMEARAFSVALAILTGAVVYICVLALLYPGQARSFWDKFRALNRA
jgi:O-antigen/teichoic acid export membrane protein